MNRDRRFYWPLVVVMNRHGCFGRTGLLRMNRAGLNAANREESDKRGAENSEH
jgi:hypothetical protein